MTEWTIRRWPTVSTRTNTMECLETFLRDLEDLTEPQGEGWYALMVHGLHERYKRLSDFAQGVVRRETQQPKYQRLIAFA
jgi:hypothetical protein